MILRAVWLYLLFRFLGYTVRYHRERFNRRTMKVLLIVGYNALEGGCVEVLPNGYRTTVEDHDSERKDSSIRVVQTIYHEY